VKRHRLAGGIAGRLVVFATVAVAADSAVPAHQIRVEGDSLRRFIAHRERVRSLEFLTAKDRLWVPPASFTRVSPTPSS